MRIERSYYTDYVVRDELPFRIKDIQTAAARIDVQDDVKVYDWPITINYSGGGTWELWFLKPLGE